MEQHDLLGNNYGKTMLMNILAAVPFLQSFFLYVTGWGTGDISSASYVTDLFFGVNNSDRFGLGTNLVGDIYVSFGLLGVILFMFVGGTLLRVLYNKAKQNLLFLFIYALVFMDAIYIARSPFFTWVRAVVWCYFIYWFYNYGKQRIWEKFKLLGA
jgi:oligosaccharide repeat unit polymerase